MLRMKELINKVNVRYPKDNFFRDIDYNLKSHKLIRQYYETYEQAFSFLDEESWNILSKKALEHYLDHRKGQLKQGFFNQLNEAFAHQFLFEQGYTNIKIKQENKKQKTPDIEYNDGGRIKYCEVKTIGASDDEIIRTRQSISIDNSIYESLSDGFLNQLNKILNQGYQQIKEQGNDADGMLFVIINFDDFTLQHYEKYKQQILELLTNHPVPEIFIKIGLISNQTIHKQRVK